MNTAIFLVLLLYIINFVDTSLTNRVEGDDTFDALDTFEPAKFRSRSGSDNNSVVSSISDFRYEYDGDVSSSSQSSESQESESDDSAIRTTENHLSIQKSPKLKEVNSESSLESESNIESESNRNESGSDSNENGSVEIITEPLASLNQAFSPDNDAQSSRKQQTATAPHRYSLLELVNSNLPKSPSKLKLKSERKNQLPTKRSPYENVFVWVGGLFAFCLLLSLAIYYLAYSGSDSDTLFDEEEKAYDHFEESNEINDGYDDIEDDDN